MGKTRLEAFSDGVLAIIITIMVLELKVPHGEAFADLRGMGGIFVSYVISFVYLGIYWNNHHHLLHTVQKVSGGVLWANLHLLFWLSLVPFVTGWMGENHFAAQPTVLYGVVLLMSAVAFTILSRVIIAIHGPDSVLKRAIQRDRKSQTSLALYVLAIAVSWWAPRIGGLIYILVAVIWLVPDRRIERALYDQERHG